MSRRRPRLTRLEDRLAPSVSPAGPLKHPYTFTEVLASVRGVDPLGQLAALGDVDFNLATSKVLFVNDSGAALVKVSLRRGADPLVAVDHLNHVSSVAWASPNHIIYLDAREFTPNDPIFSKQYFHTLIGSNAAWDTQTGNPSIVVAVTDDGLALNHPDIAPNLWINPTEKAGNGIDDDANGYIDDIVGWDFSSNDSNPNPVVNDTHGTAVAGVLAARTNNAVGVAGVAGGGPQGDGIRIMPLRFEGSGLQTAAMIAETFAYAANNGAKIINNSNNFDPWVIDGVVDSVVNAGLDYAYSKGVAIFMSAGNFGVEDPLRTVFNQSIFVAATDQGDIRALSSNYGKFVDISAPGVEIFTTMTASGGTVHTYGMIDGTSFACPIAAGAAALLWSENPSWNREQVVARLLGSTDNIDSLNPLYVGELGTGRTNVSKAISTALPPPRFGTSVDLPADNSIVPYLPDDFSIDVPMRFNPSTVVAANFSLTGDGPDNTFGTSDDVAVALSFNGGATYKIGTGTLDFTVSGTYPMDRYQFKAKSGSFGLSDPFGMKLDGNGDGVGGDDFVRIFQVVRNIDGHAYEDRNDNGTRDSIEPGVAGAKVFLDLNNDGQFDSTDNQFSNTTVGSISDYKLTTSQINVSGLTGLVNGLQVTLNISHSYVSDLRATLTSPSGHVIPLFSSVGNSGTNFTNTKLDDNATVPITAGAAPFTGTFRPEGSLSDAFNESGNGIWTLSIGDYVGGDFGTLDNWALNVFTGDPLTTTSASGAYYFTALATGIYTVRAMTPAGWNTGIEPVGGSQTVSIATIDSTAQVNFGYLRQNAIYGRVYFDTSFNGMYDPGESPLVGWTVFDDRDNDGTFDDTLTQHTSANVPIALPDLQSKSSTLAVFGFAGTLASVTLTFSIDHSHDADLTVSLQSPSGTKVQLFSGVGGAGKNFTSTVLDDAATVSITAGVAPFTGTYRPTGSLSDFLGANPTGIWTLTVTDGSAGDSGTLKSWSLGLRNTEPNTLSNAGGIYSLYNVPAGLHYIRRVLQPGFLGTEPIGGVHSVTMFGNASFTNRNFGQSNAPLPPTVSVMVNDGDIQRSNVKTITANFSEAVTFPDGLAAAFRLERTGTGNPTSPPVNTSLLQIANIVYISFVDPVYAPLPSGSLIDGDYTLSLFAAKITGIGGNLDGDGNKIGGDDQITTFHRLFGDADGDRDVDNIDGVALRLAFGAGPSPIFDNDADNDVDIRDLIAFRRHFGTAP